MWLIKYVFETFKTLFASLNRAQSKKLKVALQVFILSPNEHFYFIQAGSECKKKKNRPSEVSIGWLAGCLNFQGLFWNTHDTHVLSVLLTVEKESHICPRVFLLTLHRFIPSISRIKQVCKRDPRSMSSHPPHHLAPVCFLIKWRWLLSRTSNGAEIYWVASGLLGHLYLADHFAQQQVLKQH